MSAKSLHIDDVDRQIIACLLDDARASFASIGKRVRLSTSAVKRRVDRLQREGVITGFTARVDSEALGWTTEAFVELFCAGRTSPAEIAVSVRRHPEAIAAYTITGDANALVHLRARDIRALEDVLERLRTEPNIVQTKTAIVLSRLIERR